MEYFKKISQKGFSPLFVIVGIVVVVVIIGYVGLQPGGFLSKKLVQDIPSQNSSAPVNQWLTFESTDPIFSVKYPSDWVYQKAGEGNSDNLIALTFIPKEANAAAKANGVTLRVLSKKNATNLQDWVNKYTTHYAQDDTTVEGKGYILYKVKSISNTKVGERDAITYSLETVAAGKGDGTILASDKYIFVFLGLSGKAEDVRNQMISSLSY